MFHKYCYYPSDCLIIRRDKDPLQATSSLSLSYFWIASVYFSFPTPVNVVGATRWQDSKIAEKPQKKHKKNVWQSCQRWPVLKTISIALEPYCNFTLPLRAKCDMVFDDGGRKLDCPGRRTETGHVNSTQKDPGWSAGWGTWALALQLWDSSAHHCTTNDVGHFPLTQWVVGLAGVHASCLGEDGLHPGHVGSLSQG